MAGYKKAIEDMNNGDINPEETMGIIMDSENVSLDCSEEKMGNVEEVVFNLKVDSRSIFKQKYILTGGLVGSDSAKKCCLGDFIKELAIIGVSNLKKSNV